MLKLHPSTNLRAATMTLKSWAETLSASFGRHGPWPLVFDGPDEAGDLKVLWARRTALRLTATRWRAGRGEYWRVGVVGFERVRAVLLDEHELRRNPCSLRCGKEHGGIVAEIYYRPANAEVEVRFDVDYRFYGLAATAAGGYS